MGKIVDGLRNEWSKALTDSGLAFFRVGLACFHGDIKSVSDQTTVGNLATSLELMIKGLIADKDLSLIFKDLPVETRLLFSGAADESLEKELRPFEIEFRTGDAKTIELNECISLLYILLPETRQLYRPHLMVLSRSRNKSLHSVLQDFERYHVDRVVYLALSLIKLFAEKKFFRFDRYKFSKKDEAFLASFDSERLSKVEKALAEARKIAKTAKKKLVPEPDDWNEMIFPCPICGEAALMSGTTEEEKGFPPTYHAQSLQFLAESLNCWTCNLQLDDYEELALAGVETSPYREVEDVEQWNEEYYPDEGDPNSEFY